MGSGKVLIAIMGLDQHEVGAIAVSSALRDSGVEVIYNGRFNMPASLAEAAMQEDVSLIGISVHSWEYLYLIEDLQRALGELGLSIPVVVGGSIITAEDREGLLEKGVSAVFGPSDSMESVVAEIKGMLV